MTAAIDKGALVTRINAIADPLRSGPHDVTRNDCDGDEPARGVDSGAVSTALRRIDALVEDIEKGLLL
jgi:hypothetical protein